MLRNAKNLKCVSYTLLYLSLRNIIRDEYSNLSEIISYISYENYRQNSLVSRSFSMFHSSLTKELQIKKEEIETRKRI